MIAYIIRHIKKQAGFYLIILIFVFTARKVGVYVILSNLSRIFYNDITPFVFAIIRRAVSFR